MEGRRKVMEGRKEESDEGKVCSFISRHTGL